MFGAAAKLIGQGMSAGANMARTVAANPRLAMNNATMRVMTSPGMNTLVHNPALATAVMGQQLAGGMSQALLGKGLVGAAQAGARHILALRQTIKRTLRHFTTWFKLASAAYATRFLQKLGYVFFLQKFGVIWADPRCTEFSPAVSSSDLLDVVRRCRLGLIYDFLKGWLIVNVVTKYAEKRHTRQRILLGP